MLKAEKRLLGILRRAKTAGLSTVTLQQEIQNTFAITRNKTNTNKKLCVVIMLVMISIGIYTSTKTESGECLIRMPFDGTKVFRKPENCELCRNVDRVDRVTNISQQEFDEIYAKKARPMIVTDGTRGWTAPALFDFQFFKDLYAEQQAQGAKTECQFFPYQTEFESLRDALNMPIERAQLAEGAQSWYIGWSNCNDAAGKVLRRHYQRPYFLPATSENMALSWIFMGGPGDGAHMHVDNVRFASWQAQLRGRKMWRLAPPPECYYTCEEFRVIVEPGEILVVDTNRWYHQTHILPGDISITIGTEFD